MKNTRNIVTARFWVYCNHGWVRLALRDGESLSHSEHERHDEGHSTEWNIWEREGSLVSNDWSRSTLDCDGHTSSRGAIGCSTRDLESRPSEDICGKIAPARPVWTETEYSQRDHAAEAMGY